MSEMSSDLVKRFPLLGECNRSTNGVCSTRSCLIRGGWKPGDAVDYDVATCEIREIRKAIEAFEAKIVEVQFQRIKYLNDLSDAVRALDDLLPYAKPTIGRLRESWPSDSVILQAERVIAKYEAEFCK